MLKQYTIIFKVITATVWSLFLKNIICKYIKKSL